MGQQHELGYRGVTLLDMRLRPNNWAQCRVGQGDGGAAWATAKALSALLTR